ncbi:hypothetical protein PFICI_04491 [Pestalotiopsis fici W106-1]|uniref:Uncharacterized protein n=1 Tax=Pestalotiopsis fici (strain W106-1 / CGMCC3.15140) TaxID=1229662 RepID=W3X986_PESFW|nr:uncharacterized protein PFICI_04491 [Pestalotiopsis fici W106-1]ETS82615.1 hypothetical protein PFICI_04491 [Pestalotiopsis fici W106-1]
MESWIREEPTYDGIASRLPSFFTDTPGQTPPPITSSYPHRDPRATSISKRESFKTGIDPPRPAREGCEWVWFPGGYWAERERVDTPTPESSTKTGFRWRKRSTRNNSSGQTEKSGNGSIISPRAIPQASSPIDYINRSDLSLTRPPLLSPYLTEASHVFSLQQPSHKARNSYEESRINDNQWPSSRASTLARHTATNSPISATHESAILADSAESATAASTASTSSAPNKLKKRPTFLPYISTKPMKSFMSTKSKSKEHKSKQPSPKEAEESTPAASSALAQLETANQGPLSRVAALLHDKDDANSQQNGNMPRPRKLFGRAPWQRKLSRESNDSVSSSIREMIRGHTPDPSPASDQTTTNSATSRGGNDEQFPGNEATRIKTPPLYHSKNGRPPRSFFMDISAPVTPHVLPKKPVLSVPGTRTQMNSPRSQSESRPRQREWWEVPNAVPRWEDVGPRDFEFDMPEHLPTSPMCPANKKHKSGGTGVCVYHGRRKISEPLSIGQNAVEIKDRTPRGSGGASQYQQILEVLMETTTR